MSETDRTAELEERCRQLEAEVARLKKQLTLWPVDGGETVHVPDSMKPLFDRAQETVASYFADFQTDPTRATIKISGQRYVLMRASSLSVNFLKTIRNLYADQGEDEALAIGRSFLFDIAHVLGMEDARKFHETMGLTDPIARLSTGPVHFAYSGWAFVDIHDESRPTPDDDYFIKYDHPFSFEADAWLTAGERSDCPVCIMNAGYSSGWCEQSFGVDLTAVEITCKAAGDEMCTFVMAPPHRIRDYLKEYMPEHRLMHPVAHRVPTFFERKRVEQEMRAARLKAEESDRMKSEFLTNMSHELRTPMNALIGMTELVLDSPLESTQREQLNTVLESAESLMEIINQILDFSRIESGTFELHRTSFSLKKVLANTLRPLEVTADAKGLKLTCVAAEQVPDNLRGDAGRLRQVLVNLVGNAIKFTEHGEIRVAVALEQPTDQGLMLHFAVRDTGIGIPAEKQQSIFEPFTQVDMSSTRPHGGTGLGLAISARLVDMLSGNIWVESNPDGIGSTFHFTAQFAVDKPPAYPELVDQPVLIVSDNPQHLKVLRGALSKLEMRILSASSAHDAMSILTHPEHLQDRPLLVASLRDNVVLVELVRGRPETRGTGLIAINTRVDLQDEARMQAMRVTCLHQPVRQSELVHAITAVAAHREAAGEEVETATPPTPLADGRPEGIQILLVEDGIANQKFAVSMLSRWGHKVTIANHGQEALDLLEQRPGQFQLILMDVLMPVMDGLEATAAIRQREAGTGNHIPIVAITAQAMKGDRQKCLAAGMDHYLTKPIRRRELQELIEQLVR
jgi:signal transduction histidine kinase/DNA-binding response OmpR family regulator